MRGGRTLDWLTFHFGFSYIGMIFLVLLLIPNFFWTKNQPKGYNPKGENRFLLVFERVGEVLLTCLLCISADLNLRPWSPWSLWLACAGVLMVLYEGFWLRYFRGGHTLEDFYGSFCGVPVAGATLPVLAALCMGVYGGNLWLLLAAVILGVGHIGIHLQHKKTLNLEQSRKNNT